MAVRYYLIDWISEIKAKFESIDVFSHVKTPYSFVGDYFGNTNNKKPLLRIQLEPISPISDIRDIQSNQDYIMHTVNFIAFYFCMDEEKALAEGMVYLNEIENIMNQYCIADDDASGIITANKINLLFQDSIQILGANNTQSIEIKHPHYAMAFQYNVRINSSNVAKL